MDTLHRLAFLPPTLIEIVVAYGAILPKNHRKNQLVRVGNEAVQGNEEAFAFRMSDDSVVTWGDKHMGGDSSSVQDRLKNVKALCAGRQAFAAIVGDEHTVVSWGEEAFGADCSSVAGELKGVEGLCGNDGAFAALRRDGTVVTWGNPEFGGDSSSVRGRLQGVKDICSTGMAFAALLEDGTVEIWGNGFPLSDGSGSDGGVPRIKHVKCINADQNTFVALLNRKALSAGALQRIVPLG